MSGVPLAALDRYRQERTAKPEELIDGIRAPDRELVPGVEVETDVGTWQVYETPGHAPSHVCLHQPERKLMLSGDHLLGRTVLFFDYGHTPDPLGEYLASLDVIEPLDVDLCLPGHGKPFREPAAKIADVAPPGRRAARPGPRPRSPPLRRADRLRAGRRDRRPREPARGHRPASCCRSSSPASTTSRRSARPPGPRLRPAALACLTASQPPRSALALLVHPRRLWREHRRWALALIALVVIGGRRGDRRLRGAEAPRRRPQRSGDRPLQAGKAERSAETRCTANRRRSTGRCTG